MSITTLFPVGSTDEIQTINVDEVTLTDKVELNDLAILLGEEHEGVERNLFVNGPYVAQEGDGRRSWDG